MRQRLPRFSSPPQRRGRVAAARGQAQTPVASYVDLVVDDIIYPASMNAGDHITFQVVIRNQGTVTMPAGLVANNQQLDAVFSIDDVTVSWADQYEGALAPGATVTLTADSGPATPPAAYWVASAGTHTVDAFVNSVGRKAESNLANNHRQETFNVGTPTPPPSGKQLVFLWIGVLELDRLLGGSGGAGGITLAELAGTYDGLALSVGHAVDSVPSWLISEMQAVVAAGMKLAVGCNVGDPPPATLADWTLFRNRYQVLANAASAAGATYMAMDEEPYGFPDTAWNGLDATLTYNQAKLLAPIIASVGGLIVYPSSNFSWPGSNNDEIRAQNGGPNSYATNVGKYLIHGIIDGGINPDMLDASFHWGIQNTLAGGSYSTALGRVKSLTTAEFPTATANMMGWPDNDEGHGFFSTGEIQTQVNVGVHEGTGAYVVYQHHACDGTMVSQWRAWNAAIVAGKA